MLVVRQVLRGIEHRQAHALHAVAHRFGHLGFLIAKRIDAPVCLETLIRIHIRLSHLDHCRLDDPLVPVDGSGELDLLDLALIPIGAEGLEDDRIVILRGSSAVRAVEVAGFALE